jgi:hypothetical protein
MENLKIKSRKVNLKKVKYQIPEIDEDRYLLDADYEQEEVEKTESWLKSFSGKSEYQMSEMLYAQT